MCLAELNVEATSFYTDLFINTMKPSIESYPANDVYLKSFEMILNLLNKALFDIADLFRKDVSSSLCLQGSSQSNAANIFAIRRLLHRKHTKRKRNFLLRVT